MTATCYKGKVIPLRKLIKIKHLLPVLPSVNVASLAKLHGVVVVVAVIAVVVTGSTRSTQQKISPNKSSLLRCLTRSYVKRQMSFSVCVQKRLCNLLEDRGIYQTLGELVKLTQAFRPFLS